VAEHHDTILSLIDDADISIRLRALDLVEGMVDRHNLVSIVSRLTSHLLPSSPTRSQTARSSLRSLGRGGGGGAPAAATTEPSLSPAYKTQLANLVLNISSRSTYANVSNFEWYIDALVGLSYLSLDLVPVRSGDGRRTGTTEEEEEREGGGEGGGVDVNRRIADLLADVCSRVRAVRPYASQKMATLVGDESFLEGGGEGVAGAAAWIIGEYGRLVFESAFFFCLSDLDTTHSSVTTPSPEQVIDSLFTPKLPSLSPKVAALFVHNGAKVFARWASSLSEQWEDESDLPAVKRVVRGMVERLDELLVGGGDDIELHERVRTGTHFSVCGYCCP
jgi:AP-3 complex subunit delta-1